MKSIFEKCISFFSSWPIIKILILGAILRLLTALFFTHQYDAFNILALVKSVADTGSLFEGFVRIGTVQLYGKIYYQIAAWWMIFLDYINVLDIRYIFDTKPHVTDPTYMNAFPDLGPELYQLASLKLVQFLYDALLLFSLLKTARVLNLGHEKELTLFWAINPFLIHIGYVMFQSDLAMISCLMAGIYFTVNSVVKRETQLITLNKIGALGFFALGAVIKQVPLLMAPIAILLFANYFWHIFIYGVIFVSFYITFYQSWSMDGELIRKFFLTSVESTALFNFGFNGLNVFFALYLFILGIFFRLKETIKKDPKILLYIFALVLGAVFISEQNSYVFVQFSIWSLPLLALLTTINKNFGYFLIANILVFYKRIFFDTSLLVGSWSLAFGEPLFRIPPYSDFISKIIQMEIITKFVDTLFMLSYVFLFIYITYLLLKKHEFSFFEKVQKYIHLNLAKAAILTFVIVLIVGATEAFMMSQNAQLTDFEYGDGIEKKLSKKPLTILVENEKRYAINGIKLKIKAKSDSTIDSTIFEVWDPTTNEKLFSKKILDYFLPETEGHHDIFFNKSFSEKKLEIRLLKEHGTNEVVVTETPSFSHTRQSTFSRYDSFYKSNQINLIFESDPIDINLRGVYTLNDALYNLWHNITKKPTFYYGYFGAIAMGVLILLLPNRFVKFNISRNKR